MEGSEDGVKLLEPHLNADGYKSAEYKFSPKHCDFINLHTDGAALLGCSTLTERYWMGAATVADSVGELKTLIASKKSHSSLINLPTGLTQGCFIETSKKILLAEESGGISLWAKSDSGDWGSLWSKQLEAEEHDGAITAIESLENGQTYVTVGEDAIIKIWDMREFLCKNTFRYKESIVNDVSACVDSTTAFATAALDGSVSLWDINCDKRVKVIHRGACEARCVRWLDERQVVVGEEGGRLVLLDVRSEATPLDHLTMPAPLHRIHIQHSTGRIAVCGDSPTVSVFSCSPNSTLNCLYSNWTAHQDLVRGLTWDPTDCSLLHTVAWDGQLITHTLR